MSQYGISVIKSQNGVERDNTVYSTPYYINAQWMRFYEGRARKIGGYKITVPGDFQVGDNKPIIRSMFAVPGDNQITLYIGRYNKVSKIVIHRDGSTGGELDITPAVVDDNWDPSNIHNIWQFEQFSQVSSGVASSQVFALVLPNSLDTYSTNPGPLFYQEVGSNAPLERVFEYDGVNPTVNQVTLSGGIIASPPVLVGYGNDGIIRWSQDNDGTKWQVLSDISHPFTGIATNKIITAERTWSGSTQALLFWSVTTLVRATYNPGNPAADPAVYPTFDYVPIQDNISIMSSNSVCQYNQIFYWVGTDNLYYYNGIVNVWKNDVNKDWFYQNVNTAASSRVWAMPIPSYNEVWIFYPRNPDSEVNTQTECNAAIFHNVPHEAWNDTMISRSCGIPASVYPYPLMADSEGEQVPAGNETLTLFPIWTHEFTFDKHVFDNVYSIRSYFETHKHDLWSKDPGASNWGHYYRIAPDFRQNDGGVMQVTVNVQEYPQATPEPFGPYSFVGGTENNNITPRIDIDLQGAIVSFFFDSNTLGGFYQEGKTLLFWKKGDTFK